MKCKFEHDGDCCNCGSLQYMCKCKPKDCGAVVPMTNADCIRAMSDEELAELLANPCPCDVNPKCDGYRECGSGLCLKYLLEWLQKPKEAPPHD